MEVALIQDKKCHVYITGSGSGNLGGHALAGGFLLAKLDSNANVTSGKRESQTFKYRI